MQELIALTKLLESTIELLNRYGVRGWGSWFSESIALLRQNPSTGIDKVLNSYGGMGSFNDLVISHLNQHQIAEAEEMQANNQLEQYRTEIYQLAKQARSIEWKHSE
jgi:hypothetical protein